MGRDVVEERTYSSVEVLAIYEQLYDTRKLVDTLIQLVKLFAQQIGDVSQAAITGDRSLSQTELDAFALRSNLERVERIAKILEDRVNDE